MVIVRVFEAGVVVVSESVVEVLVLVDVEEGLRL